MKGRYQWRAGKKTIHVGKVYGNKKTKAKTRTVVFKTWIKRTTCFPIVGLHVEILQDRNTCESGTDCCKDERVRADMS